MATRPCAVLIFSDSNMVGTLDGLTGEFSYCEIPHVEAVDDVYYFNDKVYVEFDNNGGRSAEFLFDGNVGNDFGPAEFGNSAPRVPSSSPYVGKPYWVGDGVTQEITAASQYGDIEGFAFKDQNDVVFFTAAGGGAMTFFAGGTVQVSPPGMAPDQNMTVQGCGTTYDGNPFGFFGMDGKLWTIGMVPDVGNTVTHLYLIEFAGTVDTLTVAATTRIGTAPRVTFETSPYTFAATDRHVMVWTTDPAEAVVDFNFDAMTLADTALAQGEVHEAKSTLHQRDMWVRDVSRDATFGNDAYNLLRDGGWTFVRYDRAMTRTEVVLPAFTGLAALPVGSTVSRATNSSEVNGRGLIQSFDYYTDDQLVRHGLQNGVMIDYVRGVGYELQLNHTDYIDSPKAAFDVRDFAFTEAQAYKVDGTITNGGSPYETDVILLDNTSRRICGRTRSVGGSYYFRCWTPGTKSVLALAPDGGYRIAALVTPEAVG